MGASSKDRMRGSAIAGWAALLAAPAAADLIALRGGGHRAGELAACVGESCSFSGMTVPRATIDWIAFGDLTTPPPPRRGENDEVHLAGGEVVVSPIVGISRGVVATEAGSHDREIVSWVRFAPIADESPPSGGGATRSEPLQPPQPPVDPPPPPPPPEPPRSETPRPDPTPQPTGQPTPSRGARGALWTGTIIGRFYGTVDDATTETAFTIDVRLREVRYPLHCPDLRSGTFWQLDSEGSRITNTSTITSSAGTCSGHGEVTVSSGAGGQGTGSGGIWRKSAERDLTPCFGFDYPKDSAFYLVGIAPGGDQEYSIHCSNGATWTSDFASPVVGWMPSYGESRCSDSVVRFVDAEGGRMSGSHRGPCTGCCPRAEFSWSICREGASCPPPPPLPPEPTSEPPPRRPCDEIGGPEGAQLDLLLDQWRLRAAEVRSATAEVAELLSKAENWRGDFTDAMRDCNLWGAAQILVGLLTSGLVPGQPAQFSAFVNYGTQLDKILTGDPTWLLPSDELDVRYLEWNSAENYWDMFNYTYGQLGDSAPAELRARLQSCGAPTLDETLDGAYEYLRLVDEMGPLARRMHERSNHLRDHEENMLDFCLSHREVCEEYERCLREGGGG